MRAHKVPDALSDAHQDVERSLQEQSEQGYSNHLISASEDWRIRTEPRQPSKTLLQRIEFCLLLCLLLAPITVYAALKPETKAAFQSYISALESRLDEQNHSANDFLWIDRDASRRRSVHDGNIATQQIGSLAIPGGMIQHWIGGLFLPGATLARVERTDQDYADYAKMYAPDVSQPKVLAHNGDHFIVSYRITKKKIVTAVVDTVQDIDYLPLGPHRLAMRSRSESVRQVDDAGTPSEHVLPEGEGAGFLWAMNSYWRMEERDGGVYVECEAVTLSRGVPFGLGKMIDPILESFAEESLKRTLEAKKRAVEGKN